MQLDQLHPDEIPVLLRPAVEAVGKARAARKQADINLMKDQESEAEDEKRQIEMVAAARLAGKPEPKQNMVAAEKRRTDLERELDICEAVQRQAEANLDAAKQEYGEQAIKEAMDDREAKREVFERLRQETAAEYQEFKQANRVAKLLGADVLGVGVLPVSPSELEGLEVVETQRHRTATLPVELAFEKMAHLDEPIQVYDRPTFMGEPINGIPDRVADAFIHAHQVAQARTEGEPAGDDLRHHPLVEKEKEREAEEHRLLAEARAGEVDPQDRADLLGKR
jgi:hypothetical protein